MDNHVHVWGKIHRNVTCCKLLRSIPVLDEFAPQMLRSDATAVKYPAAHASHLGWAMLVTWIYSPGGHVTCFREAVQESVLLLLSDIKALKNPLGHTLQSV